MLYCKVLDCRFNYSHVTKGHKCGPCGQYGHGEIECFYPSRKRDLLQYYNDTLPVNIQCTVPDCASKELHTVNAHHCPQCGERVTHTVQNCPLNSSQTSTQTASQTASQTAPQQTFNVKCPICRTPNNLVNPITIVGLSDECCICYKNSVEVVFTSCNHCCVCMECLKKL